MYLIQEKNAEYIGWFEGCTEKEAFSRYMLDSGVSLNGIFEYFKDIEEGMGAYAIEGRDFGDYQKHYEYTRAYDMEETQVRSVAKQLGERAIYG